MPGRAATDRAKKILEVAATLFARCGYNDCEMDSLAAKLGVAKGTLYLYYRSKEELFLACVDSAMRQLQEAVMTAATKESDPFQQIRAAIRAYLHFFRKHPDYVELLIQERAIFRNRKQPTYFKHRDGARMYWRELYGGLIASGRVRADLRVEQILDAIGNMVYGTMFTNHFLGNRAKDSQQHEQLLNVLLYGILSDTERSKKRNLAK